MFIVMIVVAWIPLGIGVAALIGGVIHLADRQTLLRDDLAVLPEVLTVDDVLRARPAHHSY